MGLDTTALRFLIDARSAGASFADTITLGRQTLFMEADALAELGPALGHHLTHAEAASLLSEADGFCEPVLRLLGARTVRAMDVSPYQGATIVHDMNLPIPQFLRQSCSAFIDGGSLEHIFNFPQAVKNCMEMVRVGGHFFGLTPSNNFMGHGFYQFSPDLFFRVFSSPNGFAIERMLVYEEYDAAPRFFEVADPAVLGRRVGLINRHPTFLFVHARRVADVPIFETAPQQSDYVALWQRTAPGAVHGDTNRDLTGSARRKIRTVWRAVKPHVPAMLIEWWRARRRGPDAFDPALYRQVTLRGLAPRAQSPDSGT